ncbi:MAG: flagellar hook-length control protein FliK [Methylophilus sp.]|nr:flagellar hook-length control protein FliK [Methylophilus sp.]
MMHNLSLQLPHVTALRNKMGNEHASTSQSAMDDVSDSPNKFAEMLKTQVTQQKDQIQKDKLKIENEKSAEIPTSQSGTVSEDLSLNIALDKNTDVKQPIVNTKSNHKKLPKSEEVVASDAAQAMVATLQSAAMIQNGNTQSSVEKNTEDVTSEMAVAINEAKNQKVAPNALKSELNVQGEALESASALKGEGEDGKVLDASMDLSKKRAEIEKKSVETDSRTDKKIADGLIADQPAHDKTMSTLLEKSASESAKLALKEGASVTKSAQEASIQVNTLAQIQTNVVSQNNNNLALQQTALTHPIDPYFGKAEWNQAVNQRVVWMVGAGEQTATLTLNPPDLGPLQVVIQVDNNQVDTTFISDNPAVRQALQDGMVMLRDKMQESGMQLVNTNVSSNEQSQRDFQQAMQQRSQQQLLKPSEHTLEEPVVMQKVISTNNLGLVDTFA